MTATSNGMTKRFIAGFLALLMVVMVIPFTASPVLGVTIDEEYINSYADHTTLDGWKQFFGTNVPNTSNVGKIWTDKSVVATGDDTLTVYLSALASNKEIEGYSTLPTDTVFVLDLSGSMVSAGAIDDLVLAANASITKLLALNKHNRVGVVVYSYEVNTLLPLARYDSTATGTDSEGNPIKLFLEVSGTANVHTKTGAFFEASGDPVTYKYAPQGGGTYIQGGVLAAYDQFNREEIEPEIPDGQIQAGTNRTPVFVLMTDGAPTFATDWYATSSSPYRYGNGNYEYNAGVAFLTQLSNSFAYKKVWDKYKVEPLFYTLGMKVDDNDYAKAVLDPTGNVAEINTYWEQYVAPHGSNANDTGEWNSQMEITVQKAWGSADGATEKIVIQRRHTGFALSYTEWLKDYVTKYYSATSASGLISSFENIVREIEVQARYYPTEVGYGNNPNYNGYICFTDVISENMHVSDVKGIYVGGQLYGYTSAVREGEATRYNFSGIVGTGSISGADLQCISVKVFDNNVVNFDIPASLIPLVTYKIKVSGNNYSTANAQMTIIEEQPIRLAFDVKLDDSINPLNVAASGAPADENGNYQFWSNATNGINVSYTPSARNEYYYFTEDMDLVYFNEEIQQFQRIYNVDALISPQYRYREYVFENQADGSTVIKAVYNNINMEKVINAGYAKNDKIDASVNCDYWYIPSGTAHHETDSTAIVNKVENISHTTEFVHMTNSVTNGLVSETLGNNGLVLVTPAQGLRITKAIMQGYDPNVNNKFEFQITLTPPEGTILNSTYKAMVAEAWQYEGTETTVDVVNNVINVNVEAGKSLYIIGLPEGTQYVVDELHEKNYDYTFDYAEINDNSCVVDNEEATVSGTIDKHRIDGMNYYNVPVTFGTLVINKTVIHPYGNSYQLPDSLEFTIEVILEGDRLDTSFDVVSSNGTTQKMTPSNGRLVFTIKDGESVSVYGLPEGTEYTINEINLPDGFALGRNSMGLHGYISSTVNSVADLYNNYLATPATPVINVVANKTLSGRDFIEGESYTFAIYNENGTEVDRQTATAVAGKSLELAFENLGRSFGQIGSYKYKVVEIDDSLEGNGVPGVTYDGTENFFTVTISDDAMDGTLDAKVIAHSPATVSGNAQNGWTVNTYFNNSYAATEDTTITININKDIESPTGATFNLDGFEFELTLQDGSVVTATTDANGEAQIEVTFTPDDVGESYELTLKEINTGISGMVYDEVVRTITVEIVDDLDGTISTIINGKATDTYLAEFTNTYAPGVATAVIGGNKVLNGRPLEEGEFTFVLIDADGNEVEVQNEADGKFAFDALTFDTVGRYTYTVIEKAESLGGVTYDESVYTVTISVTDGGNGELKAETTILLGNDTVDAIQFVNEYNTNSVDVVIEGDKVLEGKDLAENEFEFVLTDFKGDIVETVFNGADGKFVFAALNFDTAGEYVYTVTEKIGTLGGISYDKSVYTVTIVVSDNGIGDLESDVTITLNENEVDAIQFVNEYNTNSVDVVIEGDKVLEGKDLAENEFEFVLTDSQGNVVETVLNGADGKFAFGNLNFTTEGEYVYIVTEKIGTLGGITYDETVYTVTIVVTDNGNGQMEADVSIAIDETEVEAIQFINKYNADSVDVVIEGEKVLEGKDLAENEFEFVLTDSQGNVVETVLNGADGKFAFTAINFDTVGEYTYTVHEIDSNEIGITYDETVYTVTIIVTDNGNGNLVADVSIVDAENNEFDSIKFVNEYAPVNIQVVLDIKKVLENLTEIEMGADGFEFILKQGDKVISETVSDENGKAYFAINFTDKDIDKTFTFTVSEVNGGMAGMTYSEAVYEYVVSIIVDENGELVANVTMNGGSDNLTAEFVNTFVGIPDTSDNKDNLLWVVMLVICGGAAISLFKRSGKEQQI